MAWKASLLWYVAEKMFVVALIAHKNILTVRFSNLHYIVCMYWKTTCSVNDSRRNAEDG